MTDQMIPADEVREIIASYRGRRVRGGMILDALKDLLPPPPRPTLADMPYEERKECQWMQADSKPTGSRVVILEPNWTVGAARVLRETGRAIEARADALTPRPDLPRMTWPGDAPAPALPDGWRLADHPAYGRVVVTTTEPDQDGDMFFVYKPNRGVGSDTRWCKPDGLTYLDTGQEVADAAD